MKKSKYLLTALLLLCAFFVKAQGVVKLGDLCYTIDKENKTAQVVGYNYELEQGVYINESFASNFGVFSTEETVGNYPWVINYNTAEVTSYVGGANNAATSWLVSPTIDFTNETEAYVAFEYIIRYSESGKVAENHQLLISTDYAGKAAEATWTNLPYNAVEGSDWATFYKANVTIPADFLGKSGVVFALRYTATTKAGTWEVKNFRVAHGKAEVVEPEEAKEYTVAEALAAFGGAPKPAVVKGYIVGSIDDKSIDDANFSGNAVLKTNLLIADNADETDYNNCMPVQLPTGAVRNALNLVDNPGNYKKMVTLTGSLEKYFGVAGLKTVTKYVIDGVTPEEPETPDGAYISESFATSFGSFTTQETVGNYPWVINYSTAEATSYAGGANNAATSWLVSPAVDFTNETEAYAAFEYIIRYAESGKIAENHQLLISDNYNGDVATATWTNLPYNAVEGTDWATFYKANVAVPAEFIGKSGVVFALRYTATTTASTWEVKNFKVAHGTAEQPETPEEPETPDTPDTPTAEAGVFDFTNPETLTPSVERATVEVGGVQGAGVESSEYTFTNGNTSVKVSQGYAGTPVRFWTRAGGDVELRTYKNSTITINISKGTMTGIVFEGGKVSTMTASTGSFSDGTWSGSAQSVTFSVTGTLNIQKLTIQATTAQTTKEIISKSADKEIIESISIPENIDVDGDRYTVTSIGNYAFYNCTGLTSITIPNSVTSIGDDAFYDCTGLTSIVIGNSVTSIGKYAFKGCTGLKEVHISDLAAWCAIDFESYYSNPLYYAHNLYLNGELVTDLVIPNSVTSIGKEAFCSCTGLTSIVIGNSVTSIGSYAFNGCTGLKTVYNFSNLTFSKGSSSNGYVAYYADKVYNAPNGSIKGDFIFVKESDVNTLVGYLGNATELTLPADYNGESYVIGNEAFKGNTAITSIEIPSNVTSIGKEAFSGCSNVDKLYIDNSVASIGDKAFAGCEKITEIKVAWEKPIRGNADIFANAVYDNATLYIPTGTEQLYQKREPWNIFFYIVEIDFTGIKEINEQTAEGKDVYYDISGRVIENPVKGIYIRNNRKVYVE